MRGAAPSAMCPRCGATTPPAAEPLVQCATCKLSFDPNAEPVGKRTRPRESTGTQTERGPAGIVLTREPGEWTIRVPEQRAIGGFYLIVGAALLAVFFGVKGYPGQEAYHLVALLGFVLVFAYVGAAKLISDLVIRIDERQVTAQLRPLRMQQDVWLGRHEIAKLRAEKTGASTFPWVVFADTPRGPVAIVGIRARGQRGADAAAFVEDAIREGLAATAP